MNFLILLLPLIIGLTWIRLAQPGNRLQGEIIHVERLPVLARLRMHAVPGLLAIAVAVILITLGIAPAWVIVFPLASGALLIGIPVSYVLTNEGIRLGWTAFRRWTEFAGVQRARGGARLMGVSGRRGMHIWLSGARGDDEFLHYLRQTVRDAYKGTPQSHRYDSWKHRRAGQARKQKAESHPASATHASRIPPSEVE